MDLHSLPIKVLKKIFAYLSFEQVAQLRGLSKSVHCAARETLNAAFLELGPRLVRQYIHLIGTKNSIERDALENTAFRGRLLKLLRSEHSILLAFCRYYIVKNAVGCFSAGKILDLFYELQENCSTLESQDEENNKVAKLVLLIDQYLDWFERYRVLSDERCSWFGTCVVDILDSYLTARYHLVASHTEAMIELTGQYTVNGYAEAPPEIGDPLGRHISKNELLKVLRYLRKHARWHNFVRAFQDDSDRDSGHDEEPEEIYTKTISGGYERIYKKKSFSIIDSYANFVSLRAIINLRCHKTLAPARLNSRFDVKQASSSGRNISRSTNSLTDNSQNDDWMNSIELNENSCGPVRSLQNEGTWFDNHRSNDGLYSFSLEIKSVHSKKWTSGQCENGEKFCETTLNINHTPESIFAAQSECRLY